MINYLIGLLVFLSLVNFIFLMTLCSFIVSIADILSQIRNSLIKEEKIEIVQKNNNVDSGLMDV